MTIRKQMLCLFLCGALFGSSAFAVTGDLAQLVNQQRFDDAWALALDHRFDQEGEIEFDLYYGMAAIETSHFSEGVFALERVVMQRPGFARARLELARGHFLAGDLDRATYHFELVQAQDPPPTVSAVIDRYLQRIEQRTARRETRFSGSLGVALGYDTNVNSATSSDQISVTLGELNADLQLDADSQAKDDLFLTIRGDGRVDHPVGERWTVFGQIEAAARRHPDEPDFDTLRLGTRVGGRWQGDRLVPQVALRAQRFYLDGDAFQDLLGISASLNQSLSPVMLATYGLELANLSHEDNPDSDANLASGSVGLVHAWRAPLSPLVNASVFAGIVDARRSTTAAEANTDRWQTGLNVQGRLQLNPSWRLTSAVQYRHSRYGGRNPLFDNDRRLDDFLQFSLAADWQPMPRVQVTPRAEYRTNRSNLELYTYDRAVAELQAQYRF